MIIITNVSKSFGNKRVLENVTFEVKNGEVVGYVGLNGAGKTTTIRIAVGVLPPDNGDVLIDGHSIISEKRRASRLVGWVPELPIFETEFKALDYFAYLAGYYGYSPSDAKKLAKDLLTSLGLGEALNMKIANFSQGMKKRFALAVSLISDPPNFIFDEVLNGLDPQGIAFFREMAIKFKKEGKAVLFSSHILSEVEEIADRVVFIHKGRIIGSYTMDEVRASAKPALEVKLAGPVGKDVAEFLAKYGETVMKDQQTIIVLNPSADPGEIVSALVSRGYRVEEFKKNRRNLEEFFFNLIKTSEVEK